MGKKESVETNGSNSSAVEKMEGDAVKDKGSIGESSDEASLGLDNKQNISDKISDITDVKSKQDNLGTTNLCKADENEAVSSGTQDAFVNTDGQEEYFSETVNQNKVFESKSFTQVKEMDGGKNLESTQVNQKTDDIPGEENNMEPVFDGTELPEMEASRSNSSHSLDADQENQGMVDKAVALKNFVRQKSAKAVSNVLRRLSGKSDDGTVGISDDEVKDVSDSWKDSEYQEITQKPVDRSVWNPLNYIKMSSDGDVESKTEQRELTSEGPPQPLAMKGRIILYTKLRCPECREARLFLHIKRLRYVEINIDIYPSRKQELEKFSMSTSVPKVFFNEILIGGLSELKALNEFGKLDEKIDFLITEAPSYEAPLPPLSGEDDESSSGVLDEMALIVSKMKESIIRKDRFYKMRRFTNCFVGSEAVDFLSEDQYLERPEAVELGCKLASELFFQHVLDENLFADGNYLYRFLDDDPIVASQCHNIPRGLTTVKPKPIGEIASRLRPLSSAIFEAYVSEDGYHVDYRSIHGSEEFARYLRIVEELHRVEIWDMTREEKLAFFINLYNMMAIHAIIVLGHPAGALERRKLFGDFKYVIGGSTYSLSAIHNGILRGNHRPPYNLTKPFSAKDRRLRVALPYPEPLVHFALVCGSRSGPSLRCYSPGDVDRELMDAARNFLRTKLIIDLNLKVAYVSKILKWFSVDFGKNEVEVMKHLSNYLDPADSAVLLDLLANSELKVVYQPYDWGLNCQSVL